MTIAFWTNVNHLPDLLNCIIVFEIFEVQSTLSDRFHDLLFENTILRIVRNFYTKSNKSANIREMA